MVAVSLFIGMLDPSWVTCFAIIADHVAAGVVAGGPDDDAFTVFVRVMTGDTLTAKVRPGATVDEVCEKALGQAKGGGIKADKHARNIIFRGRRLRGVPEEDALAMEGWQTSRGYEAAWDGSYDLLVKGDVCWPVNGHNARHSRACSICDATEQTPCDARVGRSIDHRTYPNNCLGVPCCNTFPVGPLLFPYWNH